MSAFRRITKRDTEDALAAAEAEYGALLSGAPDLARRRATRSSSVIQQLYATAVVEGRTRPSEIKAASITFTSLPFRGGFHYIDPWQYLAIISKRELASELSWMLRSAVAEKGK